MRAFLQVVKLPFVINTMVNITLLEKETAAHSSIPSWEIPLTEELRGLQSMKSYKSQTQLATKQQQQQHVTTQHTLGGTEGHTIKMKVL